MKKNTQITLKALLLSWRERIFWAMAWLLAAICLFGAIAEDTVIADTQDSTYVWAGGAFSWMLFDLWGLLIFCVACIIWAALRHKKDQEEGEEKS